MDRIQIDNKIRECVPEAHNGRYQAGIHNVRDTECSIVRSVDNTPYYRDDLDNPSLVWYTLQGKNGDQTLGCGVNKKICMPDRTIFLYRQSGKGKNVQYEWYGEYLRAGNPVIKYHPGEDKVMRKIYRILLVKMD